MHHLQPPWYPYPVQGKSITPRSTGPDTLLSQSYDLKLSLNGIVAAKKENRRLRGRINQRRYRKNQAKKIMGMQHDITLLRQEIDMYTMRLSVPWGNLVVNPKAWGIVAEYYCFVGRGISVSGSPTSSATHPNTMIRSQYPVETVLQYFQTILIPRVISSAGVGIEAHLEEWKTLSAIFPDFNMNIVRMEEGSSGEVVVTSKAVLSFSEKAFRSANSAADKLLGRKLKIFTVAHFIWDTTVARVAEIRFQADMISPLLRVLGSLDLVANIFSSARVSPEGQIIVA
ncbi:hypothetical protein PHMEG_0009593 [Phytophthora megakarya]|uniref:Bzip transcription factor n=1 Tax=Phytophthora megakarya TaxID=4795 RepID=A0A225WG47_9STRA|nr:hypothetical protein PHMEG_0009593 [Phytophthora megakarya]